MNIKYEQKGAEKVVKKLSESELNYMQAIWECPDGISSDELYTLYSEKGRGVVSAALYKISHKGCAKTVQQGRHYIYYPALTKEEYEQVMTQRDIRQSLPQIPLESLIAAFCGKKKLTVKQIQKLNKFIEDLENDID